MNTVSTWMGTPIDDLEREELLKVIEWCCQEIQRLQKDRDRWFAAGDPLKYLMQPNVQIEAADAALSRQVASNAGLGLDGSDGSGT